jgi:hypothetical protein
MWETRMIRWVKTSNGNWINFNEVVGITISSTDRHYSTIAHMKSGVKIQCISGKLENCKQEAERIIQEGCNP